MSQKIVVGVDEAGRWCWAWPLVSAAVSVDPNSRDWQRIIPILSDSKAISAKRREEAFSILQELAEAGILSFGIGVRSAGEIDAIGIKPSNESAMAEAIDRSLHLYSLGHIVTDRNEPFDSVGITIDGNDRFRFADRPWTKHVVFRIRGDSDTPEIQAASIIAKVFRDRMMELYDSTAPFYGFAQHKGYGTAVHAKALRLNGPSPFHRMTFSPMKHDFPPFDGFAGRQKI